MPNQAGSRTRHHAPDNSRDGSTAKSCRKDVSADTSRCTKGRKTSPIPGRINRLPTHRRSQATCVGWFDAKKGIHWPGATLPQQGMDAHEAWPPYSPCFGRCPEILHTPATTLPPRPAGCRDAGPRTRRMKARRRADDAERQLQRPGGGGGGGGARGGDRSTARSRASVSRAARRRHACRAGARRHASRSCGRRRSSGPRRRCVRRVGRRGRRWSRSRCGRRRGGGCGVP